MANPDPSHIQITPLEDGKWGWVVWFGNDMPGDAMDPRDRDGVADSLDAALADVRAALGGREH